MRNIWLRRIGYIFKEKFINLGVLFNQARTSVTDYQQVHCNPSKRSETNTEDRNMVRWKAPMKDFVKVNWDAAFNSKNTSTGAGVVIRDEGGEVQVSLCMSKDQNNSLAVAEITALWRALKLCVELNVEKAVFERDALGIVKAVNSA
ncbi:uncharacterized protein LOC122307471 [Carya illinoinensis]|uniref:uncharacterized protein LOC122307471 n=1 Tax=Carya illinoinensis TaxID=32201 RepID=UPI001C725D84|nr:uncharacterized protein LOC122307471 [Carya illinoinensis]